MVNEPGVKCLVVELARVLGVPWPVEIDGCGKALERALDRGDVDQGVLVITEGLVRPPALLPSMPRM